MSSYLYHYTNSAGAKGIEEDQKIKLPPNNRARFGRGIYLTSLPPTYNRLGIQWNNFRKTRSERPCYWDKTEVVFGFNSCDLSKAEKIELENDRDLYIYKEDINLRNIKYKRGLTDDFQNLASPKVDSTGGRQAQPQPQPESDQNNNYSPTKKLKVN